MPLLLPLIAAVLAASAEPASADPAAAASAEPVLFVGPTFVTGWPAVPEARAVLVAADGHIVDVYADVPAIPEGLAVKRLPGALAVPGLHDAHLHLEGIGMKLDCVDLDGIDSRDALRERVRAYVAAHPDVSVVRGFGWDQNRFADKQFPDGRDVAGLTGKPIFLMRIDGHAAVVNDAVLALGGYGTGAPNSREGGVFRGADGKPTGLLLDQAVIDTQGKLPAPTFDERKRRLKMALDAAAAAGYTAVHEMSMFGPNMDALLALQQDAPLPARVFVYMAGTDLPWILSHYLSHPLASRHELNRMGRVQLQGIKLMIDGALGSRGALLYADYDDDAGNHGHPAYSLDLQLGVYRVAQQLRLQAAVHAIGDQANDIALDWIERYQNPANLPTRVEHAQVLTERSITRFRAAGAVASMQPIHGVDDHAWAESRLGKERARLAYAPRSVLASGAQVAFGTDAPVSPLPANVNLYAAQTRQTPEGDPPGGWHPQERLTFTQALYGFTRGAARTVGEEEHLGAIAPGKKFDVTVFDRDCRREAKCWLSARVAGTVVAP